MDHQYTLSVDGFIDPLWMRSFKRCVVDVTDSRLILVAGVELMLLENEPDLPVGNTVEVWLNRWFHCESLEAIETKRLNQIRKKDTENEARRIRQNALRKQASKRL